jgi:UDP-3-O-[3-hydroxymyristoyl] glucosamine N-acyltransferase
VDASPLEDAAGGRGWGVLMATITHREITDLLQMPPNGAARLYTNVSSFANAAMDSVVFAQDEETFAEALKSAAGLILAPIGCGNAEDKRILQVKNPRYAFALIGRALESFFEFVHPSAVIELGAQLGEGSYVGAGSVIESGAVLGKKCWVGDNVVIHGCATLGDRCVIQSGVVLGGMGFGYARGPDGRHVRFPQIGTLWIGDDVEIGANTTIDRGALGETRIGRGTKIDNLVHIAHNCIVGEDVLMAAQVGMAGSCVIEDGAMLGGQVGLGEGVTIGKGVILGGQGGVLPGKRIDGEGVVYWGTPAQPVREYLRDLARMRKK